MDFRYPTLVLHCRGNSRLQPKDDGSGSTTRRPTLVSCCTGLSIKAPTEDLMSLPQESSRGKQAKKKSWCDLRVKTGSDFRSAGKLHTELYQKPTAKGLYLPRTSHQTKSKDTAREGSRCLTTMVNFKQRCNPLLVHLWLWRLCAAGPRRDNA